MNEEPTGSLFGSGTTSPSTPHDPHPNLSKSLEPGVLLDETAESIQSPEEILHSLQGYPTELHIHHDVADYTVKARCDGGNDLDVLQFLNNQFTTLSIGAQELCWQSIEKIYISQDVDDPVDSEGMQAAAMFFGRLPQRTLSLRCSPTLQIHIRTSSWEFMEPENVTEHLNLICTQIAAFAGEYEGNSLEIPPPELIQGITSTDDQSQQSIHVVKYRLSVPPKISIIIEAYIRTSSESAKDEVQEHHQEIDDILRSNTRFFGPRVPWCYDLPTEIVQSIVEFVMPHKVNIEVTYHHDTNVCSILGPRTKTLLGVDRHIRAATVDLLTRNRHLIFFCKSEWDLNVPWLNLVEALEEVDDTLHLRQCRRLTLQHDFDFYMPKTDREKSVAERRARDRAVEFLSRVLSPRQDGVATDRDISLSCQRVAQVVCRHQQVHLEMRVLLRHADREICWEFEWFYAIPYSGSRFDDSQAAFRTLYLDVCTEWIGRFEREVCQRLARVVQEEPFVYTVTQNTVTKLIMRGKKSVVEVELRRETA